MSYDDVTMVEVRIRAGSEAQSRHLTCCKFEKLQYLLDQVSSWGVVNREGEDLTGVVGQFVIPDSGAAYFELIAVCD